ncbi:MAG: bifunctional demethylmenaquinone methyltransferase/2-methoxy-6-polyprenyl-1,4-benzoquinol methylase UbiE [Muribaculaceae bacterium]|nr:bifunctional demethylmenaquinone methyltransferase/2-methoxy-6-polyprenyl-1,4-benzoquinol methylase UbiE [Muribaculaceae bacterium]
MEVENITPYGDGQGKTEQVREMFDSIAPAYDFMNRAMTLGMDRGWRHKAVSLLSPAGRYGRVLDVATGTADIAIKMARENATPEIVGVDLSEGMLAIGREKVKSAALPEGCEITLKQGDCLDLPFEDGSFDGVICAYGVRNFASIPTGLRSMWRVLRPGGRVVILELSTPRSPIVKPFYNLYTRCVIPLMGRLVSKDVRAYSYLPESIAAVPQGREMVSLLTDAGFSNARADTLCLGACSIYTAEKV